MMKKLLGIPLVLALGPKVGPAAAAQLFPLLAALLPLTFIVGLASKKRPWIYVFPANLGLMVVVGFIAAAS
jgi:hypothetical protein